MNTLLAGLVLDVVAIVCATILAVTKVAPITAVLPIISMILAARLAPAARVLLAPPNSDSNNGDSGPDEPHAARSNGIKKRQRSGSYDRIARIAAASGMAAIILLLPALLLARARS